MINVSSQVYKYNIPFSVRIRAENCSRHHSQIEKAKQVYLNTLAIATVNSYLNSIGWATNLEGSDSQNPVLQTMMNVADLEIPGYGRVECCLVLPGESSTYVSPEVWSTRIAYMLVKIDPSLCHCQILGFARQIKQSELSLTELESLAQFPAYLSQQRCKAIPTSNLSHWFAGLLPLGWQKMEDLWPTISSLSFRSFRQVDKCFESSLASPVDGVKLIELAGEINRKIALILKIQPQSSDNFNVSVTVCNELVQDYLPEGLELVILDEINRPVMIAQANQTETIEFCFSGKIGESFSVEMSLDEQIHSEDFII